MKVCSLCGNEICKKDGENLCQTCEEKAAKKAHRQKCNAQRRASDSVMRSMGLVKVKGAMGGTYWE